MAADKNVGSVQLLTQDLHVWPDLHGNRSPLADATIKGMICGLTMNASIDNLAITYLAFVQALAVSNSICSDLQGIIYRYLLREKQICPNFSMEHVISLTN